MIFWFLVTTLPHVNTIRLQPGTFHAWAKAMHAEYMAVGYGDIENGPEPEYRDTTPKNWIVITKRDDMGLIYAPDGARFYIQLRSTQRLHK